MRQAETFLAIYFIIVCSLIIGWIMNIMNIIDSMGGPIDALFIARLTGIFVPPFGGIIGYF